MMDGYGWMMTGGWLGLVLVALLVGLLVYLVARGTGRGEPRANSALEVLRTRFARGEIDRSEYEERLSVLRGEESLPRPRR